MPRLVILGRQGAGKGTQCELLSEHYGIPHVSTGDMLRAAVSEGTELGKRAKAIMDAGDLVPDDVIVGIVDERLAKPDAAGGFLLDGFPRTSVQADALVEIVAPGALDLAVSIEVPDELVIERMLARAREDDTEEAIRRRLELYETETAPLQDWFESRGILIRVDGVGAVEDVEARLISLIDGQAA